MVPGIEKAGEVVLEEAGTSWYFMFMATIFVLVIVTLWFKSSSASGIPISFRRDVQYEGREASVYSIKGRRRHMEDTFRAQHDLMNDGKISFYGVYDGHGGNKASAFAANRLHEYLKDTFEKNIRKKETPDWDDTDTVKLSLTECFLHTDKVFLEKAGSHDWPDGTTAVTALVVGGLKPVEPRTSGSPGSESNTAPATTSDPGTKTSALTGAQLYVANTGDSRAILVRGGRAIPLSDDQKPNRADERARIEASGGRIIHFGTWRVEGVLAVARALGDHHLKQWVIPDPEIRHERLQKDDTCLVLASDGVWDVLTNQDVADLCNSTLSRSAGTVKSKLDLLSRQITKKAYDKGSVDNITCLVIDLTAFGKMEEPT